MFDFFLMYKENRTPKAELISSNKFLAVLVYLRHSRNKKSKGLEFLLLNCRSDRIRIYDLVHPMHPHSSLRQYLHNPSIDITYESKASI